MLELKKHGIKSVYKTRGIIDHLFANTEIDPVFWAMSDGFDFAGKYPFMIIPYIGPLNSVMVYVVVFEDYGSKIKFEESGHILPDTTIL